MQDSLGSRVGSGAVSDGTLQSQLGSLSTRGSQRSRISVCVHSRFFLVLGVWLESVGSGGPVGM